MYQLTEKTRLLNKLHNFIPNPFACWIHFRIILCAYLWHPHPHPLSSCDNTSVTFCFLLHWYFYRSWFNYFVNCYCMWVFKYFLTSKYDIFSVTKQVNIETMWSLSLIISRKMNQCHHGWWWSLALNLNHFFTAVLYIPFNSDKYLRKILWTATIIMLFSQNFTQ